MRDASRLIVTPRLMVSMQESIAWIASIAWRGETSSPIPLAVVPEPGPKYLLNTPDIQYWSNDAPLFRNKESPLSEQFES